MKLRHIAAITLILGLLISQAISSYLDKLATEQNVFKQYAAGSMGKQTEN